MDWVATDLLNIVRIETARNTADAFTKPLGKILFHRHFDVIMGKRRPPYSCRHMENKRKSKQNNSPTTIVQTIEAYDISEIWDHIC